MPERSLDLVIRGRDEASNVLGSAQADMWKRIGGGLLKAGAAVQAFNTGVELAGALQARARYQASLWGDSVADMRQRALELHDAWGEMLSTLPLIGERARHAWDYLSGRRALQESVQNLRKLEHAAESLAERVKEAWREAELARARALKSPAAEIAALRAGHRREDERKQIEEAAEIVDRLDIEIARLRKQYTTTRVTHWDELDAQVRALQKQRDEAQAALDRLNEARRIRAEADEAEQHRMREEARAAFSERLRSFGVGAVESSGPGDIEQVYAERLRKIHEQRKKLIEEARRLGLTEALPGIRETAARRERAVIREMDQQRIEAARKREQEQREIDRRITDYFATESERRIAQIEREGIEIKALMRERGATAQEIARVEMEVARRKNEVIRAEQEAMDREVEAAQRKQKAAERERLRRIAEAARVQHPGAMEARFLRGYARAEEDRSWQQSLIRAAGKQADSAKAIEERIRQLPFDLARAIAGSFALVGTG